MMNDLITETYCVTLVELKRILVDNINHWGKMQHIGKGFKYHLERCFSEIIWE